MEKFYILENTKVVGPFTIAELQEKSLKVNSMLCKQGTDEWKKYSEFPELSILKQYLPPPAPPKEIQKKINTANAIKSVFSNLTSIKLLLIIVISLLSGVIIGSLYFYSSDGSGHLRMYKEYSQKIIENPDLVQKQRNYWNNIRDGKVHPASWEQSARAHKDRYLPYKSRAWSYGIISSIVVFLSIIGYRVIILSSRWIKENSTQ